MTIRRTAAEAAKLYCETVTEYDTKKGAKIPV